MSDSIVDRLFQEGALPDTIDPFSIAPAVIEAAKATFVATGGNVSAVARAHGLTGEMIIKLATEMEWPVYGDELTSHEKSRRSRLHSMADALEPRLLGAIHSVEIETKHEDDESDKGKRSRYVAPLRERTAAVKALGDLYLKIVGTLDPDLTGEQAGSQTQAVTDIDKRMAEIAGRAAAAALEHRPGDGEVIDVEPEE